MIQYIFKRLLLMIPTLIGAAVLIFFLLRLIPGDVCELRLAGDGMGADPEQVELCRQNLGLNDPVIVQFWDFITGFLTFDLGQSMWTGKAIEYEIGLRFQLSLQVAVMATIFSLMIALPMGTISAVKQNTWIDYCVRIFSIAGIALPSFWLGIMIILGLLISTQWWFGEPWMPPIEYVSPFRRFWGQYVSIDLAGTCNWLPLFRCGHAHDAICLARKCCGGGLYPYRSLAPKACSRN